jgi:hypothetical protein
VNENSKKKKEGEEKALFFLSPALHITKQIICDGLIEEGWRAVINAQAQGRTRAHTNTQICRYSIALHACVLGSGVGIAAFSVSVSPHFICE